jgi:hypothetical protein
MSGYNISGIGGDQQYANLPSRTTQEGKELMGNALGNRVRFDQPETFDRPNFLTPESMLQFGLNPNTPDPAKYSEPSLQKDVYATRKAIIEQHKEKPAGQKAGAYGTFNVGTDEEVGLVMELEAQKRIMEYDKYCAAMFNYKHIPGGLKAMEEINPGFTARRVAQVYSDAAYAAKNKAIEVLGQANCGHEANMFKFDVDNGVVTGPTLTMTTNQPKLGYEPGGLYKFGRKKFFNTHLPGASVPDINATLTKQNSAPTWPTNRYPADWANTNGSLDKLVKGT